MSFQILLVKHNLTFLKSFDRNANIHLAFGRLGS